MIKRGKGICAVALVIGMSGVGFSVAAVAGTAAASGRPGPSAGPSASAQHALHGHQSALHGKRAAGLTAVSSSAGAPKRDSSKGRGPAAVPGAAGQADHGAGWHGHSRGHGSGAAQSPASTASSSAVGASHGSQGAAAAPEAQATTPSSQSGQQGNPQQGNPQQGNGGHGNGQPGNSQQGNSQQGNGQPGNSQQGSGQQGSGQHGHAQQGQGNGQQGGGGSSPQAQLGNGNHGQGSQGQQGGSSGGSHSSQGGCNSSCSRSPQSLLSGTGQTGSSIPSVPSISNTVQNGLPASQPPVTVAPTGPGVLTPPPVTPPVTSRHHPSPPGGSNLSSLQLHHIAPVATLTVGGLGLGLGLGPVLTLPGSPTTAALLAAATPVTGATTGTHATGGAGQSTGHAGVPQHRDILSELPGGVLFRYIGRVPAYIWLALTAAVALAAVGTGAALVAGRRVRRQAGQFAAVSAAAMTDPLTGVLNRRGFLDALERELARARRYGLMFTLAYVDVRGLKAVNDSEGHLAGDELLKQAASLLKASARADDVVGRIGGDEMGLLLVEQGAEGADAVIRRVTSQIPERREAMGLHSPWDLTVGAASFPEDGSTVNELLATADRRLYEQRGIALR